MSRGCRAILPAQLSIYVLDVQEWPNDIELTGRHVRPLADLARAVRGAAGGLHGA
jgi:hypothetical protein